MCWKSFGVGGKAGSLLSWPSAERGCLVRGFLPVSSFLPALPSSPRPRDRCRGLCAQREPTRDAAAGAPRGERRARPSRRAAPGVSVARPAPSARGPLPPPGRPQGREFRSPGLSSAHAQHRGQPPAPGAARSWGPSDAARPALTRGLPSARGCRGRGAHSPLTHST